LSATASDVDLVLDHDNAPVVRLVGDEMIRGVDLDVFGVSAELSQERGAPPDDARPPGEVVQDLVDDVVANNIEEVRAVDEVAQRTSREIEIGRDRLILGVGSAWHACSSRPSGPWVLIGRPVAVQAAPRPCKTSTSGRDAERRLLRVAFAPIACAARRTTRGRER
jgi:hypothetical protein